MPAVPALTFSDYAWLVGRWLHALRASPAAEATQCYVLRALIPLVHQAHAVLGGSASLPEVQTWVSRIETELRCPLHQGLMQAPAALTCGHVFEDAWVSHLPVATDGTLHCPTCRNQARKMAPPVALMQILQSLRAFYERTGQPIDAVDAPPALLAPRRSEDDAVGAAWLAGDTLEDIMRAVEGDADGEALTIGVADAALPLFQAVIAGDADGVQAILATQADGWLDAQGSGGRTALHIAADHNDLPVARLLLQSGASVEVGDDVSLTPLHLAAARGRVPMIQLLLAHGADIDANASSALCEAVCMGHVTAVRALLDARPNIAPAVMGLGLLHDAVTSEEPEMVRMLLAAGCDLRETLDEVQPLTLAVMQDLGAIVDVLLDAYAQMDTPHCEDFGPALCKAAQWGRLELVQKLLAAGADASAVSPSDGGTPLHLAIANAAPLTTIEALVARGARRDARDTHGQTPEELAAQHARTDVLALFASLKMADA